MVVVVVILMAWVVILGPSVLKRRARSGSVQSISHFHHQLRILEHSAPEPIVSPAYRLRSVDGSDASHGVSYPGGGQRPVLSVVGAKDLPRPALAFLGDPAPGVEGSTASLFVGPSVAQGFESYESYDRTPHYRAPYDWDPADRNAMPADSGRSAYGRDAYGRDSYGQDAYGRVARRGRSLDHVDPRHPGVYEPTHAEVHRADESAVRRMARRRRRDTLLILSGLTFATFLVACVTGSGATWFLTALAALALGGYVAMLVHLQHRALEREDKLHYLDSHRSDRWEPSYGSVASSNHPSVGRTAAR